jgi:hypothetical protein
MGGRKEVMTWQSFTGQNATFVVAKEFALILRFVGRDESGHQEMLTLQRGIDPQDDKPGIDGVYVERGMQQYASFGGVESCSLNGDELVLTMDYEGAQSLGGIRHWRFALKMSAEKKNELVEGLSFIFRDCDCLQIESRT